MSRIIFALIFLLFGNLSYASDSLQIDSIKQLLTTVSEPKMLPILKDASWQLRRTNNQEAEMFAQQGLQLAARRQDSIAYYHLRANLGIIHVLQGKFEDCLRNLELALTYFNREHQEEEKLRTLLFLGSVLTNYGDYATSDSLLTIAETDFRQVQNEEKLLTTLLTKGINAYRWKKYEHAERLYLEAFVLAEKLAHEEILYQLFNNLGLTHSEQGNYTKALTYYFKAYEEYEKRSTLDQHSLLNNIGNIYNHLKQWDKAIAYQEKSLSLAREMNLQRPIAFNLNNIGIIHKKQNNYGKALHFFEEAIKITEKMEGKDNGLPEMLNNLGSTKIELHQYDEAIIHLQKALSINQEIEDEYEESRVLKNLGKVYFHVGNLVDALRFNQKSLEITKRLNYSIVSQDVYMMLSRIQEKLGNYQKALNFRNQYWHIKDSLAIVNNNEKLAKLEYENKVTTQDNELRQKAAQLKKLENEKTINHLKIGLLALGLIVVLVMGGFGFYFYRLEKQKIAANQRKTTLKIKTIEEEKTALEKAVSVQQQQLHDYLRQLLEKSELLNSLKAELEEALADKSEKSAALSMNDILNERLQSTNDWKKFEYYFTMVHKDFFKNLNHQFPHLKTYDLNLCALIKLNLNNKEIAQIMGISPPSVKKARQRLYVKMALKDNDALRNYIMQL